MLERERHLLIRKLVDERSIVSVGELVELLGASEATVRRAITAMAERGELRKVRGGAEAMRQRYRSHLVGVPFALSHDVRIQQKRAIAHAAAGLIGPSDSIIVSAGTTTLRLAEFLRETDLDILTNSFPLAAALCATTQNRVTMPGGTVYGELGAVLSPFAEATIAHFRADVMFCGCYGISRFGVMENDPLYAQATVRLLERTTRLVVLADSSKLRQRSSMVIAGIDRVDTLVTDSDASEELLAPLRGAIANIVVVDASESDRLAHVA
jgi:DeoR family ulaG and ulaABCDEF operon transcriptional repressor